jgi:putative tryptophan/tyrosine transport system substrate-binding protein
MRRREFIALMGASVAWPFAAMAQQAGRTYRVGGLSVGPRNAPVTAAMFDELRRFGFIEGQNLTIQWRQYTLHIDLISEFAADLVKAKVDVIYAVGDAAIRAAQRATTTIPILGSTDGMVEAGLVKSLARPEGNTTGTSILSAELDGKRQEILIEAVPGLRRMAALADSNRTAGSRLQALNEEAHLRNVELSVHQTAKPEEIPAAIDAAKTSGAAALNLLSSPLLYGNRQLIMDRVAALRLPTQRSAADRAEVDGLGPRRASGAPEAISRRQRVGGENPATRYLISAPLIGPQTQRRRARGRGRKPELYRGNAFPSVTAAFPGRLGGLLGHDR